MKIVYCTVYIAHWDLTWDLDLSLTINKEQKVFSVAGRSYALVLFLVNRQ